MNAKNILLTGPPRCGKSTLIAKLVVLIDRPLTGFFTRDIREKGTRVGFAIDTLDGKKGVLAHIQSRSPRKLGKYGVNLEEFEALVIPAMTPSCSDQIIIIDEIGKMECFSPRFREALKNTLDLPNRVLGSIAAEGTPFIERIKERNDVMLVTVSEKNRDSLEPFLLEKLFRVVVETR